MIYQWKSTSAVLLAALSLLHGAYYCCHGFYVIDTPPKTFLEGDSIPLQWNALTSVHTQIPKDPYRLGFCHPEGGPQMAPQDFGEFLTGNKMQNSPFVINMLREVRCRKLCQYQLNTIEAERLQWHIRHRYHHNWIMENMPSANVAVTYYTMQKHYAGGVPIGFIDIAEKEAYIFNHVRLIIDYYKLEEGFRVIALSVEPISVKHRFKDGYIWDSMSLEGIQKELETCPADSNSDFLRQDKVDTVQIVKAGEPILFTYDVKWVETEVPWSQRWEVYLTEDHFVPPQVHWYSITNSIIVVVILSLVIACCMIKRLRTDLEAYKAESEEDPDEAAGWKVIYGDVFRPPQNRPTLFCIFVGTGAQICCTLLCVLLLATTGWVSPVHRGSLFEAGLTSYACFGVIGGYVSGRVYKTFGGNDCKRCTVLVITIFPGIAFAVFLVIDILFAFHRSTASVPLVDILLLLLLWGCVALPSTYGGVYLGCDKSGEIEFPAEVSSVAREIPPPRSLKCNPWVGLLAAGFLPFASCYVELFFILTSLWMNQYYFVYGCAFVVYLLMLVTCIQVTSLFVYCQLCAENHQWWWYSFFCGGSIGLYLCVYSILWFPSLEAAFMLTTYTVYFGYMGLIAFSAFLLFGSAGALTSLLMVRKIYALIGFESEAERFRQGYSELQLKDETSDQTEA